MQQHYIAKERLNELAARKLEAMGVATELVAETQTLRGVLEDRAGTVLHPRTQQPIPRIEFAVESHDTLQLTGPEVMRALPPVQFYEFDQVELICSRIAEHLKRRFAGVLMQHDRLQTFGMECRIDDVRGVVLARCELGEPGAVVLEADDRALVARAFHVGDGSQRIIPMGDVPIVLEEFPSLAELRPTLGQYAEHALSEPEREAEREITQVLEASDIVEALADEATEAAVPPPTGPLQAVPPPATLVTLGQLVRALGPDFMLAPGVILRQEWLRQGTRLRLDLKQERGQVFAGALRVGARLVWKDRVDLEHFDRTAEVLRNLLHVESAPSLGDQNGALGDGTPTPVVGEVWVMGIQVIQDADDEIRYVTVDSKGERFGAPRVLPRDVFASMFVPMTGSFYRLIVKVVGVSAGVVSYQRQDAAGQPAGEPRSIEVAAFVSTFLAEASAY